MLFPDKVRRSSMSFLSLSKGDPAARALLQRAIRARYGLRPLPIDNARFTLTGQGKGPLGLPVTLLVNHMFIASSHLRWDETRKLFGIGLGQISLSYHDGEGYEGKGPTVTKLDAAQATGLRRRLWCEVAAMLTPLTTAGMVLKAVDERTFQAMQEA